MIISRVQLVSPLTLALIPTKVALMSRNISLVSFLKSDVRKNNKLESGNSSQKHVRSLARGIYSNNVLPFLNHGTIFSRFHHYEVNCSNMCVLKVTLEIPKCHLAESHFNFTTCGSAALGSTWSHSSFVSSDSSLAVGTGQSFQLVFRDKQKKTKHSTSIRKESYCCRQQKRCCFFICFQFGEPFSQGLLS